MKAPNRIIVGTRVGDFKVGDKVTILKPTPQTRTHSKGVITNIEFRNYRYYAQVKITDSQSKTENAFPDITFDLEWAVSVNSIVKIDDINKMKVNFISNEEEEGRCYTNMDCPPNHICVNGQCIPQVTPYVPKKVDLEPVIEKHQVYYNENDIVPAITAYGYKIPKVKRKKNNGRKTGRTGPK